jgi:hypothetical protein
MTGEGENMGENPREILCELENLAKVKDTLAAKISLLRDRLSPVLKTPRTKDAEAPKHSVRLTEMGGLIFKVNSDLDGLRLVVNDVLDRLEI